MIAYLILILAACSRLLPHALHGTAVNFTAVGGGLLFFGARRPRWQAAVAALVMALTDVYLTRVVYGFPFHMRGYLLTWAWYAAVCLLGSGLLRRVSFLRVGTAVFASATSFFLLSNFAVWVGGAMYVHSFTGLSTCYVAGLPFYGNDLLSTGLVVGVLLGLPVLATRMGEALGRAQHGNQPLT